MNNIISKNEFEEWLKLPSHSSEFQIINNKISEITNNSQPIIIDFDGIISIENFIGNTLDLSNFEFKGLLKFNNIRDENKNFNIKFNKIGLIQFEECTIGKIHLWGNNTNKIEFKKCNIAYLEVFQAGQDGLKDIAIIQSEISILHIKNINNVNLYLYDNTLGLEKESKHIFEDLSVNKFTIIECNFLSDITRFKDIQVQSLMFSDVDFGKSIFSNLNIENIFINNVIFINTTFYSIKWPLNYHFLHKLNEGKDILLSDIQLKDIYSQMKFVMDKNGNFTEGNQFYQREMEYYGKSLKFEGSISNRIEILSKKVIFSLQKLFGDFGNSWFKSFLWLIILVFVFTLYESYTFPIFSKNYDCILKVCSNDFKFGKELLLNFYPLNNLGKEDLILFSGGNLFFLIFFKLFYGIFIYYIGVGLKRSSKR